ncbi:MAG: 50S ribosomal protein L33 [Parcubacteria group bacterium GW2011_GWA2_51_12]|nr:MAG: 50S ribosomal protein L33 [Parcubacteria group bacterium GW2011_GWA2_51_12]
MAQENLIKFQCTSCKRINYQSTKNRKKNPESMELSKYCKWERKHTAHKEMKK